MAGVLIKRWNLDTEMHTGRTPSEDEGRDGAMLLQAQGCQRQSFNTGSQDRGVE